MTDQTLWELAQHFRDANKGPLEPRQCAILLEGWAREKAKKWEGHYLAVCDCVADLGVPEGE